LIRSLNQPWALVDLFITNDTRLHAQHVEGLQFIVPLDRAPL
jgi:hypothetical protein